MINRQPCPSSSFGLRELMTSPLANANAPEEGAVISDHVVGYRCAPLLAKKAALAARAPSADARHALRARLLRAEPPPRWFVVGVSWPTAVGEPLSLPVIACIPTTAPAASAPSTTTITSIPTSETPRAFDRSRTTETLRRVTQPRDQLDLNRDIEWQFGESDRRARVSSRVTKHLDE